MQIERGWTARYLSEDSDNDFLRNSLLNVRNVTDEKLQLLSWWPVITLSETQSRHIAFKDDFYTYFNKTLRVKVLNREFTFEEAVMIYSEIIKELMDKAMESVQISSTIGIYNLFSAFNALVNYY